MIETEVKDDIKGNITIKRYYAYADNERKTWFITCNKRKPFPGLILLFKLGCIDTNECLYNPDISYPCVGTVLTDINGRKLKVLECDWV